MRMDYLQELRDRGQRVTPIRIALLRMLAEHTHLHTPDQLAGELKEVVPSINRTTVYRELTHLAAIGLVRELQLGARAKHYELNGDCHHHAVCTTCGRVERIDLPDHLTELTESATKQSGFTINRHSLEFFGTCANCKGAM